MVDTPPHIANDLVDKPAMAEIERPMRLADPDVAHAGGKRDRHVFRPEHNVPVESNDND